jgi:hypothetical protein
MPCCLPGRSGSSIRASAPEISGSSFHPSRGAMARQLRVALPGKRKQMTCQALRPTASTNSCLRVAQVR